MNGLVVQRDASEHNLSGTESERVFDGVTYINAKATKPSSAGALSWGDVRNMLGEHEVRSTKDGAAFSLCSLRIGTTRSNENVHELSGAVCDVDTGAALEDFAGVLEGLTWCAYSTHSHNPDIGKNKFRIVLPFSRNVTAAEWFLIWPVVNAMFGGVLDGNCKDASRLYYLPSCPEETKHHIFSFENGDEGMWLDPDVLISAAAVAGQTKPNNTALTGGLVTVTAPLPETPENVTRVQGMLAVVPANCDRETWRNICWAVQSLGWTCGVELVREWSMTAGSKYDAAEFDKLVSSFNPAGGIGPGTLFRNAKAHGWVEPAPDWLDLMNSRFAWIDEDAGIYRIDYRSFITVERFNTAHANQFIEVSDGDKAKSVSVSRAWITNAKRRQHTKIVLRPGEPEVTSDGALNDWRGYSVQPVDGDVGPWLRLYRRLFGNDLFPLLWLAHKIQKPGIKKHTCLVVWSGVQGVGKNLLIEAVGALFNPRHFNIIGQSEVDDDFTGWMPGRVFVLADEIKTTGRDKTQNRLNIWTTATTLKTHDKGQPKRDIENLMDMVFLSNHADALFLSDADRRFWVHEVTAGALPADDIRGFISWRDTDGLAHLLHYLMTVDLSGFDPKCRAPITEAKREMIEAGRSDLDRFCRDIVTGGIPMTREIVTAEEVAQRFAFEYPLAKNIPPTTTVAKVLVKMGAYARPNQIRLESGRKVRAIAVSRTDHWKGQSELAWRDGMQTRLPWVN